MRKSFLNTRSPHINLHTSSACYGHINLARKMSPASSSLNKMKYIATRVLVLSDTHGEGLQQPVTTSADVVIYRGDITEESKLDEFRAVITMLKAIDAPVMLVIAGNHDFALDDQAFSDTRREISGTIDGPALKRTYGDLGEARALFDAEETKASGIMFLDEGIHRIPLANGALMTVYASPHTPSKSSGWGYQYGLPKADEKTDWMIEEQTSAADTAHSAHSEEELRLPTPPNRKRKADALDEVGLSTEYFPRRQPAKRICRTHLRRPTEQHAISATRESRQCADIEDSMGRVRRQPTAGVRKFQRHPELRIKR